MFDDLGFITLFQKGGITIIILLGFSVLSIGVTMERLWVFTRTRRGINLFSARAMDVLKARGREAAYGLCETKEPMARIFKAGLVKYGEGKEPAEDAMELTAKQEILCLERYLGILGTIGSTAPFIGLFGTVLGIIRAFQDLALGEGAGPSVVADGIAEALIATAAGLFVAVPAVISYNYFTRRVAGLALEIESRAAEFSDMLFKKGGELDQ